MTKMYSVARIVGDNSVSALMVEDKNAADKVLMNLDKDPDIIAAILFDKNGKVFTRYNRPGSERFIFTLPDTAKPVSSRLLGKNIFISYKIFLEQRFFGTVIIRAELLDFNKIISNYILVAIFVLLAALIVALAVSSLLQRAISTRLLWLVSKTKDVSDSGNYSIRVSSEGKDEIAILSEAFNNMLEQIEKTQHALKEINIKLEERVKKRTVALIEAQGSLQDSEEKYRKIVEEAGDFVYASDDKGYFTYANPICKKLTGYTENEFVGKLFLDVIHPEWKDRVAKFYKEQFKNKTKETMFSFPIVTKSGEKKWVEQIVTEQVEGDRVIGHKAIVRDITQRKTIEEEIKKKSEELARSNKELEQYAYVASHDLQEPLRTISNFVGLFNGKYKGKLDKDAEQYLKFIVNATSKMQILIKDLLDFSRIGINNVFKKVDCNVLLTEVVTEMNATIKESKTKINSMVLPVVSGNEMELKRLFQNLISNAIKFQKKGGVPEINISVEEKDSQYVFGFKDNGIGIEDQFIGKLFVIFQRLNDHEEYHGTGIGLATCKKIVNLHDGKIWVESKFGEGSIFYFSLPKKI